MNHGQGTTAKNAPDNPGRLSGPYNVNQKTAKRSAQPGETADSATNHQSGSQGKGPAFPVATAF